MLEWNYSIIHNVTLLCGTIYQSSNIHMTIFKYIINKTLSRAQKFEKKKKRQVFSLKCQPVFSGEVWLSVLITFSIVHSFVSPLQPSCPRSSQQLPSGSSPPSPHPFAILHRTQSLLHTCPANGPRVPAATSCGTGSMIGLHHILKA